MSRRRIILGASLAACGAALGIGVGWVALAEEPRLEPTFVQVPRSVPQGEVLSAFFSLQNPSGRDCLIERVDASCGCMTIVSEGGRTLKTPFRISPREQRTLELQIATQGRRGLQEFLLDVRGAVGGRPFVRSARVQAHIEFPLFAEPHELYFRECEPGKVQSQLVRLIDFLPDPGVIVREVVPSNPSVFSASLQARPKVETLEVFPGSRFRYELEVRYWGAEEAANAPWLESIKIIPLDDRYPEVILSVHCSVRRDTDPVLLE